LQEAGAPHPVFTLMTPTTSDDQRIAQVVQSMVKDAGFEVRIQSTEFATSLDLAERKKIYAEIAAIVLKDRPIVYLYHRHWLWAYTNKLSGLRPIPDGLVRVQGLRLN